MSDAFLDDARDDIDHYKKIRTNYKRRLQLLEQQEALYGVLVDPRIQIEIEDIKEKMRDIGDKIYRLTEIVKSSSKNVNSDSEADQGTLDNEEIQSHSSFSFNYPQMEEQFDEGYIITANGKHNLPLGSHVWVFLIDKGGGYYLQNPPVRMLNNQTWIASNICLGRTIRYIVTILVNEDSHLVVRGWVEAGRWGRIEKEEITALLGHLEVARIRIHTR